MRYSAGRSRRISPNRSSPQRESAGRETIPASLSARPGRSPQLNPGDIYAGFDVERKFDSDPLGDRYLARDTRKDRAILIRIFDPAQLLDSILKKKLLDQARTASKLDHPHIQRIVTLGKSKSCYYLATEYVRGETLHDKLRGRKPLDYLETMKIFAETVDALDYAPSERSDSRRHPPVPTSLSVTTAIPGCRGSQSRSTATSSSAGSRPAQADCRRSTWRRSRSATRRAWCSVPTCLRWVARCTTR